MVPNLVGPIVLTFGICFIRYGTASAAAAEWHQFPQMRHVDEFSHCVGAEGGVYCTADVQFVAEGPNELYDAMKEYSKPFYRFNRTKGIYGFCMKKRCKEFLTGDSDAALETALGACLNSTLEPEYGLRARIESHDCYRHGEKPTASYLDWAAAALLLVFVAMVAAGTFYDLFVPNKDPKGYLMCFSLPANWAQLTAPWPKTPAMASLKGLNGFRSMLNMFIIGLHALLVGYFNTNLQFSEDIFKSFDAQVFINMPVSMQTFIFLSGLLLAYNMERSNEKSPKTWRSLPRAILLRWLRLAPVPYAVLLFCVTWQKFHAVGPLYQVIDQHVKDCRRNWHGMFFFTSNYIEGMICNMHFWSTAADLHMHIIGLSIMLLSPTKRVRNSLLWMLLAISLTLPPLETYFRDLNGTILLKPDLMKLADLAHHGAYSHLHIRTHNNLPSFVIGMLLGIQLHAWQKNPIDFTKYKKYTTLYWLLLPGLLGVVLWNAILLWVRNDMPIRVLTAALRNPAWTSIQVALIVGMIYKVETPPFFRRIWEWDGWVLLAKLSYCSYNIHLPIMQWYLGTSLTLLTGNNLHTLIITAGIITISYLLSVVVWLVLEAPCTNLVAKLFPEKQNSVRVYSADDDADNKKKAT